MQCPLCEDGEYEIGYSYCGTVYAAIDSQTCDCIYSSELSNKLVGDWESNQEQPVFEQSYDDVLRDRMDEARRLK